MVDEDIWRSSNASNGLSTLDEVIQSCKTAGFNQNKVCIHVTSKPRFWAKYGFYVTRGEGLTQAHIAEIANIDPVPCVRVPEVYVIFSCRQCVYILMELSEGRNMRGGSMERLRWKLLSKPFYV
ncbi:hypothetical protein QCA50_010988 [Cerrena zonata]|uniref:Uncharacterized protein n=1 Tax=Cerrena zonata TaxID=2478898 RepID=A0AAW0G5S4_9APHY